MYHRRLVVALAAGTAIVGTMIPVMSSASADKPSLLGCAADTTPPTTVLDDAGTDRTVSTTTTTSDANEAPATAVAEDADIAPSTETAPPSTESVASDVPDESVPALGADVDVSTATAPSGVRSTRSPAADPIKHKYEITVKITTVKGQTKIDKWEFTAHGNPCRITGVEWSIGLGGSPGSYFEYYTLVITDPALDKDKCRPLIYVNGSSSALTGVTTIAGNSNFTAVFNFDRKGVNENEFRIVIECT